MAALGAKWRGLRSMSMVMFNFALAFVFVSAERGLRLESSRFNGTHQGSVSGSDYLFRAVNFLWQSDKVGYEHVWPVNHTTKPRFIIEFCVSWLS